MSTPPIKIAGWVICAFVAYAVLAPAVLWLTGAYPNTHGTDAASSILEQSKDPDDCRKIVFTFPFSMLHSAENHRFTCTLSVARSTHDVQTCMEFVLQMDRAECLLEVYAKLNPSNFTVRTGTDCDAIVNVFERAKCQHVNATAAKSLEQCADIAVEEWRELCVAMVETIDGN